MAVDTAPTLETVQNNARKAGAALDAFDTIVEGFIKASGVRVDRFGYEAVNQPDFVHNMRKGRDFRRGTMRKVLQHIEQAEHSA